MSESSDVFSFGVLMFKSLFKKDLYATTKGPVGAEKMIKKPPMCSLEEVGNFKMDHLKLLAFFALKAANYHVKNAEGLLG